MDRPVPFHIESTAGIPLVNRIRIGVDGDAPLCLFDLEGGIRSVQVDIVAGVAVSQVPVGILVSKGDIALVFDVQVAGGVHRQRIAIACKGDIGDDVLVGDDIHRSIVQHTHAFADDGMVDTAVGIAFTGALDIPPAHLDLQLGVVLHGQAAGGMDAIDSIALRAALAVIHVDVHGGAAKVERMVIILKGHPAAVNAFYDFVFVLSRIRFSLVIDVQGAAAGNGHVASVGVNGCTVFIKLVAVCIDGQRFPGGDTQPKMLIIAIQQAGLAVERHIIPHIDHHGFNIARVPGCLHVNARPCEVALQMQVAVVVERYIVAVLGKLDLLKFICR